ncbi:kelch-like protein 5 [Hetaerina americana]|uniref:kelch-like protein 5 n=1 Tax=Hetaerina americana TaxID=62018 RepID=UPI003A7F19F0
MEQKGNVRDTGDADRIAAPENAPVGNGEENIVVPGQREDMPPNGDEARDGDRTVSDIVEGVRTILSPERATSSNDGFVELIGESLANSNGQEECFRSGEHAECSLKRMEDYLNQERFTDVTLIAGNRRIPAHRLVLSAASEYFSAMFTGALREAGEDEVTLVDLDPDALQTLVHYCYTGWVELREECVETLLVSARILQLPPVVSACCSFLLKQLHPSNCIGIRLFADAQSCPGLCEAAHKYTSEHFMEVIANQEFLLLPADEVATLLVSDDLNVPSEEIIFHALMSWLHHDPEVRSKEASRLLGLVRLPLLSPAFIADNVATEPLLAEDVECQSLVMEALTFHALPERRPKLMLQLHPRAHPRKATLGKVYAVGGMDAYKGETSIECYDPRSNTWSHIARMPGRRLQFGVALMEGVLHPKGSSSSSNQSSATSSNANGSTTSTGGCASGTGSGGKRWLYVVGGRDNFKTLNTVEAFDLDSNVVVTLPPMSTHRHGLGVGVLGGALYGVGGHDGWSYLNTVERWDPVGRQWSYVAPMATQRSTVGVAVLHGKLYAVGGRDGSSCLRSVERFDAYVNRWCSVAPLARRRGGVVAVAAPEHGAIYALGGHDAPASKPAAARYQCVERYDPRIDAWMSVAPLSVGRDAMGACMLGDLVLAVGGYDGSSYLPLVEAYDPHNNSWQQMAPLSTGRAGACVVVLEN